MPSRLWYPPRRPDLRPFSEPVRGGTSPGTIRRPVVITESDHPPGEKKAILFVDDDELIRGFGTAFLEHLGYTAFTAADGEEGVAVIAQNPGMVSLVVLDLLLPDMSGRETYERIRAVEPDMRFVITSGLDFSSAKDAFGMDIDPDRFIAKPFSMGTLSRAIQYAFEHGGLP